MKYYIGKHDKINVSTKKKYLRLQCIKLGVIGQCWPYMSLLWALKGSYYYMSSLWALKEAYMLIIYPPCERKYELYLHPKYLSCELMMHSQVVGELHQSLMAYVFLTHFSSFHYIPNILPHRTIQPWLFTSTWLINLFEFHLKIN